MCGIVGFAGKDLVFNRSLLTTARDSLRHRGPDDAGEWWSGDGRVGFGHRRLSIIDPSPLGHQPMVLPERGLSVVFNGELYNHLALRKDLAALGFKFRSNSDTEVLLFAYAAWGEDCLARFNGMFTFALYDEIGKKLFLARDRAGEKPLFYRLLNGVLQFASELKALLADKANPRDVDPEALDCYLAMGFVPGDMCIIKRFKKLPPAHALRFDLQSAEVKVWRYWELPEPPPDEDLIGDSELLEELDALLSDAVRQQMVADVPVGVLLSGGVDSSLVTAMAARASSKVRTFTVGFPGHGKLDETKYARLIAQYFGTQHTELMAEDVSTDLLPQLARQFDEPIADSSMIATFLVSKLVREYCSVALGGDGGDELFGGYGHYSRLQSMKQGLGRLPLSLRKLFAHSAERFLPVGFKGRNWVQGLAVDLKPGLPITGMFFDMTTRRNLMKTDPNSLGFAEALHQSRVPTQPDLVQRATRMDFGDYLAEDILVKVDRASMLTSLEMRAPLLDYRIIEFAFGRVPSRLKATPTERKIMLKRLASRLMPTGFDLNRKQGFSVPMSDWMKKKHFRDLLDSVLRASDCCFDRRTVDGLLIGQSRGYSNSERLFALVQFELWRREYSISV